MSVVTDRLVLLWQVAAEELAARCCTCTTRDLDTITRRVEHEGLSFLTITLPGFADDFQKSLDDGRVTRNSFTGFQWKRGLPKFLSGFLGQVFDSETGWLLDAPSVEAIYAVRQLTLMFGKIRLKCTEDRVAKAITKYIECEQEVRRCDSERTAADYRKFTRMSLLLWADVLDHMDRKVRIGDLLPKHGPGATADRLRANAKYVQLEWTQRLEEVFPYGEYVIPSWRHHKCLDRVNFLEPGAERPVRVITVPKTLKTPRIIAIEPTAMQYMQQALLGDLVATLQSKNSRFGWLLGFRDQTVNHRLARKGSSDGSLATLDLSEASDRVSNQLVRAMTSHHPEFQLGVDACRSRSASLDEFGKGEIRLAKFASMGSALTFPMEAMVFATCVFLGIESALNRQLTVRDIQSYAGKVRIYGDDIIVPVEFVHSVIDSLEAFGLVVNRDKSFWTGKFRESCGREYYGGDDVSVVRVRSVLSDRRRIADEVISTVSLRNRFYEAGLWGTARYLDEQLSGDLRHYPTVPRDSSVLGRWSVLFKANGSYFGSTSREGYRIHPRLHHPLVKGYTVRVRTPSSPLDGVYALQKVLLLATRRDRDCESSDLGFGRDTERSQKDLQQSVRVYPDDDLPVIAKDHLSKSGRSSAVDIKLRWSNPLAKAR